MGARLHDNYVRYPTELSAMVSPVGFWNFIAKRYSRSPVADEAAYRKKLEITQQYWKPIARVLEFGCGTGSTALVHALHVEHIRAIDVSDKMIDIANQKLALSGVKNVTFECAEVNAIDPREEAYDVVLGLSVLHLLENWRDTIYRVERLLKPGGIFVSSTACLGDSMTWFKYIAPIGKLIGVLPNLEIFTSSQLLESIKKVGFEIEHEWQPGKNKAVFIVARKPK